MNHSHVYKDVPAAVVLDGMIREYGPWRVFVAVLAALIRRRPGRAPPRPVDLPDRLRADVGLHPLPPPSPRHWDIRL